MSEPFYSYRSFLRDRYGKSLFSLPVNLNFSCPNRNEDGKGGCTFCGENGALAVHLDLQDDLREQVSSGLDYIFSRYGKDVDLMAYFQAYTSTNAPIEKIREAFETVLEMHDFKAVKVSTRPDCLPDEVMEYFAELAKRYDFWVELGVQTANDKTLERINRGHDYKKSAEAAVSLAKIGVNVAGHVILGLPGETQDDFRKTAEELAKLPLAGLKIHNLHIVKNTGLEQDYRQGKVDVWDEHEYGEVLIDFLRRVPKNWPIMRVTSDTPQNILVAPIWWMKKGQFLGYLNKQMKQRGICQGDLLEEKTVPNTEFSTYEPVKTDDGSVTFYSDHFKEHFHSSAGAVSEAYKKFVEPTNLKERVAKGRVRLLDIGFGLGCNALTAWDEAGDSEIEIVSLEMDRNVVASAMEVYPQWKPIYQALLEKNCYSDGKKSIRIIWGDARRNLADLAENEQKFDLIFHDAFSTQKNPELWSLYFFRLERGLLAEKGIIVTYSNAKPVRGALIRCGLEVGETRPFGRARGGTIAACQLPDEFRFDKHELRILTETTTSVPYFDPGGKWSRKKILQFRDKVVKKLQDLGIPKRV